MNEGITLQHLEAEKKRLETELDLVQRLIALRKGEAVKSSVHAIAHSSGNPTVRGRVVDAVLELIQKNGRQVTNQEILAYVEEKQLSLGNAKNKVSALGAILSQECHKKSARLRQVTRGVYDLK